MRNRLRARAPILIFFSSLIILFYFSSNARDFVNMDAMLYGEEAKNILQGKPYSLIMWIDQPLEYLREVGEIPETLDWIVSPLYALVVAFFFKIWGVSFDAMKYVGVFFGSLTILATYYLGNKFLNKKSSLLAPLLVIIYPFFIYNSIIPGNEVFTSFFVVTAFYFSLLNTEKKNLVLQGIFSGIISTVRYEVGILTLLSLIISYFFQRGQESSYDMRRGIMDSAIIIFSFIIPLSPLIFYNFIVYKSFIVLPSIVSTFFGMPQTSLFFISPILFLMLFFLLIFFIYIFLSFLKFHNKYLNLPKTLTPLVLTLILTILLLGKNSILKTIYNYSPLLLILGLTGLIINFNKIKRFLSFYLFIFLFFLFYATIGLLNDRYTIVVTPILAIFASSAICKISTKITNKSVHYFNSVSKSDVMVAFTITLILLASFPQYVALTRSNVIIMGPFVRRNWDKAISWVANNTEESDTIMAQWPNILFYSNRRTITLLPKRQYNDSEILSIIHRGNISYIVIDWDMRHMITNNLITHLYDNPGDIERFRLVYTTGVNKWSNPGIVIYKIYLQSEVK